MSALAFGDPRRCSWRFSSPSRVLEGPSRRPGPVGRGLCRQVTLFAIIAVPWTRTYDRPEARSRIAGTASQAACPTMASSCSTCAEQAAWRRGVGPLRPGRQGALMRRPSWCGPLDENGKVAAARCQLLRERGLPASSRTSATPSNQLFFCDRTLDNGSRLLIGVGAALSPGRRLRSLAAAARGAGRGAVGTAAICSFDRGPAERVLVCANLWPSVTFFREASSRRTEAGVPDRARGRVSRDVTWSASIDFEGRSLARAKAHRAAGPSLEATLRKNGASSGHPWPDRILRPTPSSSAGSRGSGRNDFVRPSREGR